MTDPIQLPPFPIIAKPKRGAPCNGCGWCCHEELCYYGRKIFGEDVPAPCPAMIYEEGRVKCGLVMAEKVMAEKDPGVKGMFSEGLGIGEGCCSDDPRPLP